MKMRAVALLWVFGTIISSCTKIKKDPPPSTISTMELAYSSQVSIGDNAQPIQRIVDKIIFPDSLRREVYQDDQLVNLTINIPDGFYFIKFDEDGSASLIKNNPFPIRIWPLDYVNNELSYSVADTLIDGNVRKYFYNDSTQSAYIFDLQSKSITSISMPDRYGEKIISFSNYLTYDGFSFPQVIKEDISRVGYRREVVHSDLKVNPLISKDEFLIKQEWQSWKVGDRIPEFTIKEYKSGDLLTNETFEGKILLIDFWATWCKPCLAEFPNLEKLYAQYHEKGFEILGISLDEDPKRLEKYVDQRSLMWVVAHDEKGFGSNISKTFKVAALPKPILVNGNGEIIALDVEAGGNHLERKLSDLIGGE